MKRCPLWKWRWYYLVYCSFSLNKKRLSINFWWAARNSAPHKHWIMEDRRTRYLFSPASDPPNCREATTAAVTLQRAETKKINRTTAIWRMRPKMFLPKWQKQPLDKFLALSKSLSLFEVHENLHSYTHDYLRILTKFTTFSSIYSKVETSFI